MTNPMIKFMLFLSLLVTSIGADDELMKKECSYTVYQTPCLKCLQSDPTSHQADRIGFSSITIHCIESQLHILVNNVTSLLSRKVEDEAIKKVLKDCNKGFSIAKLQLSEAKDRVVNSNYDKAIGLVKSALSYPLTCRDNLQKLKFKESIEVYDEISCYSLLSAHFSHGEPSVAQTKEPVYCRSKKVFNGPCTSTTCFLDFLGARSASEMPKNCKCTSLPNMHLCECEVVCDGGYN